MELRRTGTAVLHRVLPALAWARGAAAVHPRGVVRTATLHRHGLVPPLGVPQLDRSGASRVLVRFSRGAGLTLPLPDLLGLALRIGPSGVDPQDLLLSSSRPQPLLRHLIIPGRSQHSAFYSSLVPFRTSSGVLLMVGAVSGPDRVRLLVSGLAGPWREVAGLELDHDPATGTDQDIDFDPVLHPMAGLEMPAWLARFREPAYQAARSNRHARVGMMG